MIYDFIDGAAVGFVVALGALLPLHDRWRTRPNRYQWSRFARDPLCYRRQAGLPENLPVRNR